MPPINNKPVQQQVVQNENKPPIEEKKRKEWGNKVAQGVNQKQPQAPSNEMDPRKQLKQKKKEDWNYLKQTLHKEEGQSLLE